MTALQSTFLKSNFILPSHVSASGILPKYGRREEPRVAMAKTKCEIVGCENPNLRFVIKLEFQCAVIKVKTKVVYAHELVWQTCFFQASRV